MATAVYPGSFDPVTNGHVDIATRASRLFDKLVVAVFDAPPKRLLFTTQERVEMMEKALAHLPNVTVESYKGLTVDYVRQKKAEAIVRGLRAFSDFEMEFQMALMNKNMSPEIDVVCLITNLDHQFISSSLVKEVALLGGYISNLVPSHVEDALLEVRSKQLASMAEAAGDRNIQNH